MPLNYREQRRRTLRESSTAGVVVTALVHILIIVFGSFSGLKYIYPPPEEKSILIEFDEVKEPDPIQVRAGRQPRAVNANPSQKIELVKQSEAQLEGHTKNEAKEATLGDDGDVDVYEPKREKEIDNRALFHAADNKTEKDTLAPQTAAKVSEALSAGHADGNSKSGKTTGEPNARLKGRNIVGNLPSPSYDVQESGKVVVNIWVDQYGNVTKAVAGAEGTTVTNTTLWNAARKAAMGTHFNMSSDAPVQQQGTITYIFNLK